MSLVSGRLANAAVRHGGSGSSRRPSLLVLAARPDCEASAASCSGAARQRAPHAGRTAMLASPRRHHVAARFETPAARTASQARGMASSSMVGRGSETQSFSDAHFGHQRDKEEQRARQKHSSTEAREVEDSAKHSSEASADKEPEPGTYSEADHEHAVISTFDLFSIGIGPSSSHTVGPMRAGNIFVADLLEAGLLAHVAKIRISLYGSLAATGEGHMTPSALLLGLESANVETVDTAWVPARFGEIRKTKKLHLGRDAPDARGGQVVDFDYERDLVWEWGKTLPLHSNGMRLTVFDAQGTMLATNDLFSVGGGFVVNGALSTASSSSSNAAAPAGSSTPLPADSTSHETTSTAGHPSDLAENMYYKNIRRSDVAGDRKTGADLRFAAAEDAQTPMLESQDRQAPQLGDARLLSDSSLPISPHDQASASAESSLLDKTSGPQQPRYPFRDANSLLALCRKHNLTIAQIVYENERSQGYTDAEIRGKVLDIWNVMDNCIKEGVQAPAEPLPGSLKLNRRAPALYRRLTRGLYPSHDMGAGSLGDSNRQRPSVESTSTSTRGDGEGGTALSTFKDAGTTASSALAVGKRGPPRVHGSFQHPILPSPTRRTTFPAIDYLTVYAMAVNEVNAAGGRVVTAPTNGAAGIIPAVLKYTLEFMSDDEERDVYTFLLTASAIGMLYKRGATISAAEGGCMAEVGVACSMAAGAFAACMGAAPETVEQAAEIGIEHNLGLTCDPIGGLVQAPCIERNALGAIKAIASANLALSSSGTQKVSLDDAIRAMRLTAQGMRNEFKETSLSGLATTVSMHIPVSVPDC